MAANERLGPAPCMLATVFVLTCWWYEGSSRSVHTRTSGSGKGMVYIEVSILQYGRLKEYQEVPSVQT